MPKHNLDPHPRDVATSVVQRALARHSSYPGRWEEEAVTDTWAEPRSSWADVHPDELIPSIPPPPPRASASTPIPAATATPASTYVPTPPTPLIPSTGPVALDVDIAAAPDEPEADPFAPGRTRLRRRVAFGAVAAMLVIAVTIGARLRAFPTSAPSAAAPPTAARAIAAAPAPTPSPASPAPAPAATEVPAAPSAAATGTTGTVIGSQNHRLYVDGHVVPGWRAEVACGTHSVKNGSRGGAHVVQVPCGGEVTVTPY